MYMHLVVGFIIARFFDFYVKPCAIVWVERRERVRRRGGEEGFLDASKSVGSVLMVEGKRARNKITG